MGHPAAQKEPMLYGGQAIIKGVMMRSPKFFAVACRRASGAINTRVEPIVFPNRPAFLKWPLVRGSLALFDSMVLGIKALMWSASLAMEDIEAEEAANASEHDKQEMEKAHKVAGGHVNDVAIGGALVVGLGFGVLLFIILPNIIAGWLSPGLIHGRVALNLVEGVIRVSFFLLYIAVVGFMPDIREVFEYHGGEHRAINTFEAGLPLTFENTKGFGTVHVRCGTNFILIVLVLSIVVFSVLPWSSPLERILGRLVLLPLVAGMAYEVIRFAGRNTHNRLIRAILAPGLALQYITTRPPSDDQVEVALASLNCVVEAEKSAEDQPVKTAVPQAAHA